MRTLCDRLSPRRHWHGDWAASDAQLILIGGGLLAAGIAASAIAVRLRVPALVLFLTGTCLALIVAFVARPLAAFASTVGARFSVRERAVLGWAGLRGGVPVVLATFPVIEGIPRSLEFFNLVFFAVLVSTLLQGATVAPLARRLRLGGPLPRD